MITFNILLEGFELKNPENLKSWLKEIISENNRTLGEILYVLADDTYIYRINKDFLNHDSLTDIITFETSVDPNVISGEIFISIDRVKENAIKQKQPFENEFARVLVHGVLHLIGYNDKSPEQKLKMRAKEDYCLNLLP